MRSYELRFTFDPPPYISPLAVVRFHGDQFPVEAIRAMRDGLISAGYDDAYIVDTTPNEQVVP
jgi:hypothetical protein